MANTVSDLEAERAKILEEIENKAKNMPSSGEGHTLQDWLKAADQVVPESALSGENARKETEPKHSLSETYESLDKGQRNPRGMNTSPYIRVRDDYDSIDTVVSDEEIEDVHLNLRSLEKNANERASLQDSHTPDENQIAPPPTNKQSHINSVRPKWLGVAVNLTLLIATLGVVAAGYNTMHNELVAVKQVNSEFAAELDELRQQITVNPESTDSEPKTAAENLKRIQFLQNQLVVQENKIIQLEQSLAQILQNQGASIAQTEQGILSKQPATQTSDSNVESKLSQVVKKLQALESQKPHQSLTGFKTPVHIGQPEEKALVEPTAPTPPQFVQEAEVLSPVEPKAPAVEDKPKSVAENDIEWLRAQPSSNYIIQLASLKDKNSLLDLIKEKGLIESRIVPQIKNNRTRHVLITGSFTTYKKAVAESKLIQQKYGIEPWVRKVDNLTKNLN